MLSSHELQRVTGFQKTVDKAVFLFDPLNFRTNNPLAVELSLGTYLLKANQDLSITEKFERHIKPGMCVTSDSIEMIPSRRKTVPFEPNPGFVADGKYVLELSSCAYENILFTN